MAAARILTLDATLTTLRLEVVDDVDGVLETADVAHRVGIDEALELIRSLVQRFAPAAMIHHVSRGADRFPGPVLVDGAVLEQLCLMTGLDPVRMPAAINLLASVRAHFPGVPQIACFGDAFAGARLAASGRRVLAQRGSAALAAPPRTPTARIRRWTAGTGHPPR